MDGLLVSLPEPRTPPRALTARLSLMYFLDVAVIASYLPLLALHMKRGLAFSEGQVSAVFAVGPVAALIAPPLAGFLADRVLSAHWLLSLINLARAGALLCAARAHTFPEFFAAMATVSLVSAPSSVLTSAVAFSHLPAARQIGKARVWGTLSWIFVLWALGGYLARFGGLTAQLEHTWVAFVLGAAISLLQTAYSLALPRTTPMRLKKSPLAFVSALGLLRAPSFLALMVVSSLIAVMYQFFVIGQTLFYTDPSGLGLDVAVASRASSVCQLLEALLFPFLGRLVQRFGIRRVLLFGLLPWPIRFLAYAYGHPGWLVILIQGLHGINVVCAFMGLQVAIETLAPKHIRASAQALYAVFFNGIGALSGQLMCGLLLAHYTLARGGYDWRRIYLVPLALSLLAVSILIWGFRPPAVAPPAAR
ncbi:MAG TPA: MFS transporter [Polyangiaceae bacterium]